MSSYVERISPSPRSSNSAYRRNNYCPFKDITFHSTLSHFIQQLILFRRIVDEIDPNLLQILPEGCPSLEKKFGFDQSTVSIFRSSEVRRLKLSNVKIGVLFEAILFNERWEYDFFTDYASCLYFTFHFMKIQYNYNHPSTLWLCTYWKPAPFKVTPFYDTLFLNEGT